MNRFATLNAKAMNYEGTIMPKPRRRLDREVLHSGNWFTVQCSEFVFEVTHSLFSNKFIVDLHKKSCSCNFWELVGIPYRHAVSAIRTKWSTVDLEEFVHSYYSKETYKSCYSYMISPINGQDKWPKTNDQKILPPAYKRGAGRPKKLRRREPDEDRNPHKLRKTNSIMTYRRCHQKGHNTRTCKVRPPTEPEIQNSDPVKHGDVGTVLPTQCSQTDPQVKGI